MSRKSIRATLLKLGAGLTVITVLTAIVLGPSLTVQGVPVSIILKFLQDEPARDAYFSENKQGLHNRLQELGVEEEIKAFYRPQFSDETELDQHIHQIFYDATGYVGKAYRVNAAGTLVLIDRHYEKWYPLAYQAGVVVDSFYENDTHYVVGPDGITAPYRQVAKVFPIRTLKQLIELKPVEDSLPEGNQL
ncbi:hypothetical protein [Acaryochloris sp. IP29b_bin.148]|uniref:hypothetical protein n=1 Tax=Acaryochloris sp. IP29b_bin.148 TaxID=2969218 RepID=UPI00261630AE|nr:hypothetical protein [Acaryochloris sp. IP29b_bin.148]